MKQVKQMVARREATRLTWPSFVFDVNYKGDPVIRKMKVSAWHDGHVLVRLLNQPKLNVGEYCLRAMLVIIVVL